MQPQCRRLERYIGSFLIGSGASIRMPVSEISTVRLSMKLSTPRLSCQAMRTGAEFVERTYRRSSPFRLISWSLVMVTYCDSIGFWRNSPGWYTLKPELRLTQADLHLQEPDRHLAHVDLTTRESKSGRVQ